MAVSVAESFGSGGKGRSCGRSLSSALLLLPPGQQPLLLLPPGQQPPSQQQLSSTEEESRCVKRKLWKLSEKAQEKFVKSEAGQAKLLVVTFLFVSHGLPGSEVAGVGRE